MNSEKLRPIQSAKSTALKKARKDALANILAYLEKLHDRPLKEVERYQVGRHVTGAAFAFVNTTSPAAQKQQLLRGMTAACETIDKGIGQLLRDNDLQKLLERLDIDDTQMTFTRLQSLQAEAISFRKKANELRLWGKARAASKRHETRRPKDGGNLAALIMEARDAWKMVSGAGAWVDATNSPRKGDERSFVELVRKFIHYADPELAEKKPRMSLMETIRRNLKQIQLIENSLR